MESDVNLVGDYDIKLKNLELQIDSQAVLVLSILFLLVQLLYKTIKYTYSF